MDRRDQSITELLQQTIHDAQDLVRSEITLAKAELRDEIRRARSGAMLLGAAAGSALIAAVFLLTAAARAIAFAFEWPIWTGFAIVGGLLLVGALVLGVAGRSYLNGKRHMPHTADTMKENLEWMRARTS